MKVQDLTVALRVRSTWEAIDLGVAFVRQHGKQLWPPWLLTWSAAAVGILILPLPTWMAIAILWWLKPCIERQALGVVSRSFFGESLGWRDVLRTWNEMCARGVVGDLLWRRLSPWRSFLTPVRVLEGMHEDALRQRLGLIHQHGQGAAFVLTAVGLVIEIGLVMGTYFFVDMLGTSPVHRGLSALWIELPEWSHVLFVATAMALVGPFYTAGGFMLYVNRRVYLEGWDIELALRRLGKRLSYTLLGAGAWALAWVFPPLAQASDDATVRDAVEDILLDPVFVTEEFRSVWTFFNDVETPSTVPKEPWIDLVWLFDALGEVLKLLPIALLIAFVVAGVNIWRARPPAVKRRKSPEVIPPQDAIILRDAHRKLIPVAVALQQAHQAWKRGDRRSAMQALYVGALSHLSGQGCNFPDSATEWQCLQEAHQKISKSEVCTGFSHIVMAWVNVAYGDRTPSPEQFQTLCANLLDWEGGR